MTVSERIVVTGASGQLGRLVVADLLRIAPEARLIGIVRNPAAAKDLADRGVELRVARYEDAASFAAALAGADKVLLISSSEARRRIPQHRHVIDAAKVAGAKLFAYTSILHADTNPMALAIDGSGDVWVTNNGNSSVTEFIGVGVPVITPLAAGVASNKLGTRP